MKAVFDRQDAFEKWNRFSLTSKELLKIKGGDGGDDDFPPIPPFGGG